MEQTDLLGLMHQLIAGLDTLQIEYGKLFEQHRTLESKLATAKDQYRELAKLLGKTTTNTPPLSLTSITPACPKNEEQPLSTLEILEIRNEHNAAQIVRTAIDASSRFRAVRPQTTTGVKIWSGPSADPSITPNKLPSITESPMEQDFTIVGVPSKLGCPFASMAGKKLSTHAASVLSRYSASHSPRDGQSVAKEADSVADSSVSRLHGRDSLQQGKSQRRNSLLDPIKAEICGLDNHDPDKQLPRLEGSQVEDEDVAKEGEPGVCPIRFLNQHSPEELAQYFQKHKHELPRSHEVCVRRYQSDEQQVRELDAKYGDVAQMIRGLGEKHQSYLPKDLEDAQDAAKDAPPDRNALEEGRVEIWATSLATDVEGAQLHEEDDLDGESVRVPHFSRQLRDVRLGESPSRPWGIQIPAQYTEKAGSDASSAPAQIKSGGALPAGHPGVSHAELGKGATCPFANAAKPSDIRAHEPEASAAVKQPVTNTVHGEVSPGQTKTVQDALQAGTTQSVVFTGPVIIGYGPEEAARFLQSLAQALPQNNTN